MISPFPNNISKEVFVMDDAPKWYETHLEAYKDVAYVKGMDEYKAMYEESLKNPDAFWGRLAKSSARSGSNWRER